MKDDDLKNTVTSCATVPDATSTLSAKELGELVKDKLEGLIGQIYFCLKITSKCILGD